MYLLPKKPEIDMKQMLSLKTVIISAILIFSSIETCFTYGKEKSDALRPTWIGTVPQAISPGYLLIEVSGTGGTLEIARNMAFQELVYKVEAQRGISTSSKTTTKSVSTFESGDNNSKYSEHESFEMEFKVNGEEVKILSRLVDEYWEREKGWYIVYNLYQVKEGKDLPKHIIDKITLTERYGAAPVLMSVIPGVGQWYKGSKVKGSVMFVAEAASVASIIVCENKRANYMTKVKEYPKFAKEYHARAKDWETGRNISIGVAAGVWLWNIVDAAVAKGARRVVVNRPDGRGLAIHPYSTFESSGLTLAYKF